MRALTKIHRYSANTHGPFLQRVSADRDTRLQRDRETSLRALSSVFSCFLHTRRYYLARINECHRTTQRARAPVRRESFLLYVDSEHARRSARSYPPLRSVALVAISGGFLFHRPCWSICVKKEAEKHTRGNVPPTRFLLSLKNSPSNRRVLRESSRAGLSPRRMYYNIIHHPPSSHILRSFGAHRTRSFSLPHTAQRSTHFLLVISDDTSFQRVSGLEAVFSLSAFVANMRDEHPTIARTRAS